MPVAVESLLLVLLLSPTARSVATEPWEVVPMVPMAAGLLRVANWLSPTAPSVATVRREILLKAVGSLCFQAQ